MNVNKSNRVLPYGPIILQDMPCSNVNPTSYCWEKIFSSLEKYRTVLVVLNGVSILLPISNDNPFMDIYLCQLKQGKHYFIHIYCF